MARISSLLIYFTFCSTLILAQSDIPITSMKMDSLYMKSGQDFKGLVLDENIKVLVFKSVEKKSGGQLKISTFTVDRKDIENVVKISPKDRALLESKFKELANGNVIPPKEKPVIANLPKEEFDVALFPQGILLEPTRIREAINPKTNKYDVFFISPNTNRIHLSPAAEKQYLALRKGLCIQGNEQTGNVTDGVFYNGEIITASDTGHITTWQKDGSLSNDKKVLGKPIRLMVPLKNDLLAIDQDWQIHLLAGKEKVSLTPYALPLLSLMETPGLIVARHGNNNFTAWDKTGRKIYTKEISSMFDYLVSPDDAYLLAITENSLKVIDLEKKTIQEIPIDRGSYCTFVTVSVRASTSLIARPSPPERAVLFQANRQRQYLLLDSQKVVWNEIKSYVDGNSNAWSAEVALVNEIKVYPGIRKINDKVPDNQKQPYLLLGSSASKALTVARGAENLSRFLDKSDFYYRTFERPLAQWNHFHTSFLPSGNKLDFEAPYKYTSLPGEISPTTSTIFLDNKVAYISGDKYFHLLGDFRGNFKIERGDYFHIGNVCLNNSGTRLAHSAFTTSMWIWDTENNKKMHTLDGGSPPTTMALSGDGKTFLSCHAGGKVILWNMETGATKSEWEAPGKPIKAILNTEGSKVFLHCEGNMGFVLPTNLDKTLRFAENQGKIISMPLGANNLALAMPAYTWNPTWKPKFLDHEAKAQKNNEAAFDPDGNKKDQYGVKDNQDQFISMSQDGKRAITLLNENTVACWDLEKSRKLFELRHDDPVACLKISNNGKWIITGNENYQASLFDGNTGAKLKTLEEHYGPIYSVGFFKSEKYAVLGCKYGVLFLDIEKRIVSHTLLRIGGILFYDSEGNFDCDHRAEDFIAFQDRKTKKHITSWQFISSSIDSPFQKILRSKRNPGMLKRFLEAENIDVLLDPILVKTKPPEQN